MTALPFPPPDPASATPPFTAPTLAVPRATVAPPEPGPSLPRTQQSAVSNESPRGPRRPGTVVLVLAALAIAMVVLAVAAIPILQGDSSGSPAAEPLAAPATSLVLRPDLTVAPVEPASDAAPDVASGDPAVVAPPPDATPAAPDTTIVAEAPETTVVTPEVVIVTAPPSAPVAADPEVTDPAVAESKAVVRGGQIFLEGAVPTAESGELIAALAAEILGPDNVFNNYVVDPRASDPNLGNVTVEDTINFDTGSSVILPESEGLLNQALALMTIRPSVTVIVVGHTDDRGSDEYNLALSEQRAQAVKTWLTDRGIDGSRLTVVGKGESEPIADNGTADGQRLNRRIQFFLENLLADS